MSYTMPSPMDPNDRADYDVSFAAELAGRLTGGGDDSITSHTAVAITPGITVDSSSHSANVVKVWLTGGEIGEKYLIEVEVVTADGRTYNRSFKVKVKDL